MPGGLVLLGTYGNPGSCASDPPALYLSAKAFDDMSTASDITRPTTEPHQNERQGQQHVTYM